MMNIQNIIYIIADIVIYYYSLIREFKVTDKLRLEVADTIMNMWKEYTDDMPEWYRGTNRLVESVTVMQHEHTSITIDIFEDITYEIISYFDNGGNIYPNLLVLDINDTPFSGITLTHGIISNIIEFYLN